MQVKLKNLFYTLKCKYFFSFLCVLILKALICDLNQGLEHCLKVIIVIGWTLSEDWLHARIEDLNIMFSLYL